MPSRPNILWLTSEDNSTFWIGCYGNPHAQTPNIDRLASESFQYMNAFANAPVCAPSRSTWITGMYAVGLGTHPMRSRYNIPHDQIRYYPDYLRAVGYYCANRNKTDYNIGGRNDSDCWGADDFNRNRLKTRQSFFQIIHLGASHESQAQGDVDHTLHRPEDKALPTYLPDLPDILKNYAKYYDAGRPDLYNHSAGLNAADLVQEANPVNLFRLTGWLQDEDPGLRYWGTAGILMLDQQAAPAKDFLINTLSDNSHEVRVHAAWSLFKLADKESCYRCLTQLIKTDSYASLTVLNTLDWMGPFASDSLMNSL